MMGHQKPRTARSETRPFDKSASYQLAAMLPPGAAPPQAAKHYEGHGTLTRRTFAYDDNRAHRQGPLDGGDPVRIHRSEPERGFTIIPNATLQDQRLSMTARGVLADILSRPDGWQTNADAMVEQAHKMRPNAAEGRRAMRAAYAELEAAGYLVRTLMRGKDGTMRTEMDVYDTPQNEHRGTGTGTSAVTSGNAHSPRSHRGTAYRPSVSGTSIQRQNTKTDENKEDDAAGAASLALNADALSKESDDADASSADGKPSARTNGHPATTRKPKPPTLDQRLDAHLQALGPDTIDEMYRDLDNDRTGITMWAVKRARKALGLDWTDDPEEDPGGPLARKAVALALMALSKPDGGGITPSAEHLLGDFDWPDERAPSAARPEAKERPSLPRVKYFVGPDGASDDDVHQILYKQVDALSDEELAARIEQLRTYRPRIYRECSESAAAQAQRAGGDWSAQRLDNLTFKYAIRHYEGRWPMFVVPSAERGTA